MKLVAALCFVAVLIVACSAEFSPPPDQPSGVSGQNADSAVTTSATETPVVETTPTEIPTTADEPTSAPTATTPVIPQPEQTAPPMAPTAISVPTVAAPSVPTHPTTSPTPTPTAIETSEMNILRVTIAEVPANLPDYDRHDWKHWTDADGDCQDARNEVLVAESQTAVSYRTDRRCRVSAGEWLAPYTSTVVTNPSRLDVDHMVPLRNAHLSGASNWSAEQREQYANHLEDPQHLIAVTASANRSKGASGPEDWKPDDRSYWCRYAIDWITIKDRWDLTATVAEFTALEDMLATCDVPYQLGIAVGMEKPDLPSFGGTTPRPTPTPVGDSPAGQYNSCDAAQAAGETLVQGSQGSGKGFPKWMVPSARDGDGDGVVCEK